MRRAWCLWLVLAAVGCKAESGGAAGAGSGGEDAAGAGAHENAESASGRGGQPSEAGRAGVSASTSEAGSGGEPSASEAGSGGEPSASEAGSGGESSASEAGRGGEPSVSTAGRGGAPGSGSTASAKPSLTDLMRDYKRWTKRQSEPRPISTEIFALCRLPSLAEMKFVESVHGDYLALLDWVNDAAVAGLEAGGKPAFPIGAAIVKEKLRNGQVAALGIMIKRAAGFDAAHGDWEFGYWEEASGLSSGGEPASSCGGCHAGAQTDFVFMDASWRLPH